MLLALALLLGPWADPKAELEAASAAYDRAVSKADIQVLDKLLLPGVVFTTATGRVMDKKEVLAMLASYVLSRTLVPTLVLYLMQHRARHSGAPSASGRFRRIHLAFEAWFERFRQGYVVVLAALLPQLISCLSPYSRV